MGFVNRNFDRKNFVNIIGGKFAIKTNETNPQAVVRTTKENKTVYEIHYDELQNVAVTEIGIEGSPYGDNLVITGEDVGEIYKIQIPVESRYFSSLCNKLPNIDFNQPVTFSPYNFESEKEKNKAGDPKKISGINVFQSGVKIQSYYSKENNHDKPTLPEKYTDAQLKIFFIQQTEFFKELVKEIGDKLAQRQSKAQTVTADEGDIPPPDDSSDLPFLSPYFQRIPSMINRRRNFTK